MTTFEEAKVCPKCGQPGEAILDRVIDKRSGEKLYRVYCRTELCRWFDTAWAVQVDGDGKVFERNRGPRGMDKTFKMSPAQLDHGQRVIEDLVGRDLRGEEL